MISDSEVLRLRSQLLSGYDRRQSPLFGRSARPARAVAWNEMLNREEEGRNKLSASSE